MPNDEIKKIIEGTLNACIYDWETDYSFKEDLPHIAEEFTEEILKKLEKFMYKIIKVEKYKSCKICEETPHVCNQCGIWSTCNNRLHCIHFKEETDKQKEERKNRKVW